jgi:uncharacterized membrane protein
MARGPENKILTRERVGSAVQVGGVIGGLIGLLKFDPVLAVVGAAVWLGGKWYKNTGQNARYA